MILALRLCHRVKQNCPIVILQKWNHLFDRNGSWRKKYRPQRWHQQDELLDDPDFIHALQGCMEKLPIPWFSAIQLKYLKGKEGKEISQELGITASNYWQILHRTKLQLRSCLEKWLNI